MAKAISFVELAAQIVSAINFESHPFPIPWKHRYRTVEVARGVRLVVEENEDLSLVEVPLEEVVHRIVAWMRLQMNPDNYLTVKRASEVAQMWVAISEPIQPDAIKSVRWKSEPGHTWRRLPWDQMTAPTPTWDKILAKMTNAAAFRQWLGSLLFEEAKQHQYVWVHGMGNDGKGSMNRFLKAVFGRSYRSKQPPAPGDKFWTYGLIGARLVVFPDCNSQRFTTGGMFKSLSGGDPIDVEAKGKMSFTVSLDCKFLFFSNEKPNLSCEHADMRRIIYCEFVEKMRPEDRDPLFEHKLWDEGGAFMTRCAEEYLAACPDHRPIICTTDAIEDWVATNDEEFQLVFDELFMQPACEEYRDHRGLSGLTKEQLQNVTITPTEMQTVLRDQFRDQKSQVAFRDWLYKKYGVTKRAFKRDKETFYCWVGIHRQLTAAAAEKMIRMRERTRIGLTTVATPSTKFDL